MDFLDPNTWDFSPQVCRVYLDARASSFVLVDEEDYLWAIQWKWHINKPHPRRLGKKQYAVRSQGRGGNYQPRLYLHVEIMKRTGILPLTELHRLVDHKDGNEFNCCRINLRWATPRMNRLNRFGVLQEELFDGQFCQDPRAVAAAFPKGTGGAADEVGLLGPTKG